MFVRPVLTDGSECWSLRRKDENTLQTFERREQRKAYRTINVYDVWRSMFNCELYYVYNELEVVKELTAGRVR
jgi:hypothetical protein